MNLDQQFGACRPAGAVILAHELRVQPRSRIELTSSTGQLIAGYLDASPAKITSVFAMNYHLLWLMDESARIFVAVEEILDQEDRCIGALPLAVPARPVAAIKLGHPSLLEGDTRHARIGGEIVYDPDWDAASDWVLTNKSGRYGLRTGQTEAHLRAAHGLFEDKGLYLGLRFIRPRLWQEVANGLVGYATVRMAGSVADRNHR